MNLAGHHGEVFTCVWNPVHNQLASGSADGMCRLWDLSEMTKEKWNLSDNTTIKLRTSVMPHATFLGERFKDITIITWSPDGLSLATGCYTGEARIWDSLGNLKMVFKEHTEPVFSLKWNKNGALLLSGGQDRRTLVWNSQTGCVERCYTLHGQPVMDVDWRDTNTFATCSSDMYYLILFFLEGYLMISQLIY